MKLVGRQYLNKNNYDKLIIDLCKDEIEVKFTSKDKIPRIKSFEPFTDLLVGLTDEEKVIEIVKYFLRSSKINEIVNSELLPYYEGWFSVVRDINNRLLALKLINNDLAKEIVKLIKDKYREDRCKYYLNNDVLSIGSSTRGYYYGDNLCLNTRDGINLLKSEKTFLRDLIQSRLDYINEANLIRSGNYNDKGEFIYFGDYLICNDLKIGITTSLIYRELFIIVNDYNYELEKNKEENYQLKLKI